MNPVLAVDADEVEVGGVLADLLRVDAGASGGRPRERPPAGLRRRVGRHATVVPARWRNRVDAPTILSRVEDLPAIGRPGERALGVRMVRHDMEVPPACID